ncbi:MAG: hypothetical protein JEY99_06940 [Spirochaetales bacterium]|nr:hypothetical protein [Spirochaetales bacterium]
MAKLRILFLMLITSLFFLAAEENLDFQPLPKGFQDITLGLSMDETRAALMDDAWFLFRGEPDVSLLSSPNQTLIDSRGADYVSRGLFQFKDDFLYTITIILNSERMDYFSMFTSFNQKYGEFSSLNPDMAVWEDDTVRISLEKPLSVKYIHKETFETLRREAARGINLGTMNRQEFIDQF